MEYPAARGPTLPLCERIRATALHLIVTVPMNG